MYVATYHVAGSIVSGGDALATECSTSSVSPQELAYEFLLFDTPTCLE
jgi:hypothetical protein